ncbi:hypothetical protein JTB14_034008 [Gonioctena quinquepunctata]|nr:hypothetical protein JTB14_034008 [Gonioctena quinquepunctata]
MCSDAFKEWTELFDRDVSDVWKLERKELQKAAMLLWTLQKELKSVHNRLESELSTLRQQLNNKDSLERKRNLSSHVKKKQSPITENKENKQNSVMLEASSSKYSSNVTEVESPDLFRILDINCDLKSKNESNSQASKIIDLSLSDDDKGKIDDSPTLISKHKRDPRKSKSRNTPSADDIVVNIDLVKKNIFRTPGSDVEMSVIESTPDLRGRKPNSKTGEFISKRKGHRKNKNLTLTQIYSNMKQKPNTFKKFEDGEDSDETYFEANKSKRTEMGITDLLSYINETNKDDFSDAEELDSTQEVDQFSKGAFFNETACSEDLTPKKKPKLNILEPEPIVRGNARKLLKGFACTKCANFYGQMNLSPEELQKKMDECSKHRYTYQPPEDTIPGLWDLTIAPPE